MRTFIITLLMIIASTAIVKAETITINYYGAYETIEVKTKESNINLTVDPSQFKSQSKIDTIANKFCKVNYTISFNGIYYKDCPKVDLKDIAFDSYIDTQEIIQQTIDANRDHQAHVDAVIRTQENK